MLSDQVDSSGCSLRVEPLRAAHLAWLQANERPEQLPRLQAIVLRSWIARLDEVWPGLAITRQPRVLVASENEGIRSIALIQPYNRQGTCWHLALQDLTPPSRISRAQVVKELLQQALVGSHNRSRSWVIHCSGDDQTQLDVLRELGFQSLRTCRIWRGTTCDLQRERSLAPCFQWSALNRRTVPLLWPLEQAASSSHLRQIVDRRREDLLDHGGQGTGVLLVDGENGPVALAGLLRQWSLDGSRTLELLRGLAWDARLEDSLPIVLNRIGRAPHPFQLLSDHDDQPMAQLLETHGWEPDGTQLLLGRSLWRRQWRPRALPASHPLDTVLGRLQPQRPPLPTPSLGRR